MQMFIAGEYTDTASGETTTIYNPATGEVVDTVPKGTAEDVQRAVAAAEEAAVEWGKFAPSKRGECLAEAARLVLDNEKELTELLTKEQGKAHRESVLEIRRFAHTLEHYARHGQDPARRLRQARRRALRPHHAQAHGRGGLHRAVELSRCR